MNAGDRDELLDEARLALLQTTIDTRQYTSLIGALRRCADEAQAANDDVSATCLRQMARELERRFEA
jgi:hypothetical protein